MIKKIKLYFIYGFAFSAIVSFILMASTSIIERSFSAGYQKYSYIQFVLFWIGGMFLALLKDKLGVLKME